MTKLSLKSETAGSVADNVLADLTLREDAHRLAGEIFKSEERADEFAGQLINVCIGARGKDYLIVHNPGGWGHARTEDCLEWEKGIVAGVTAVLQKKGYSCLVTQYFRSGYGWREEIGDLKEQLRFFSNKSDKMAAWLKFITAHIDNIKAILIGVSQGAAFGNAVMQRLGGHYPVYSIELGFPSLYKARRVNGERTLAIDDNGDQQDKLVQGTILDAAGILMAAPFKWLKHRMQGNRISLPHCVSTPGHEYDWGNPAIAGRIRVFLETNFARHDRYQRESFRR